MNKYFLHLHHILNNKTTFTKVFRLLAVYSPTGLLSDFLYIFHIYLAYICLQFLLTWLTNHLGFCESCRHIWTIVHPVLNTFPTIIRSEEVSCCHLCKFDFVIVLHIVLEKERSVICNWKGKKE